MPWKPDLTAAAIVERDGRFLLVEERVGRRIAFNQPAGHVEAGESFVEAAVREALEESAWTFVPEALVGIYLWTHPENKRTFLRVAFCGKVHDHQPERPLDKGILRTHWMTREQVLGHTPKLRSPMVLRCIDDYLAGIRHPLQVLTQLPTEDVLSQAAVV